MKEHLCIKLMSSHHQHQKLMYSTWFKLRNLLILKPFRHFTYVTTHSPTLPSLYLRHSSFSNPSVASPSSQLILQPFFRFSYVTGFSLTSSDESPMVKILSMTSFGKDVKPWVPYRRLTARKRPEAEIRASEQNFSDFSLSL